MTKEMIIEKLIDEKWPIGEKSHYAHRNKLAKLSSWGIEHQAMDEYAKQEAIGFANFVGDRPIPEYSASTNKWRWWSNEKREYEYATTDQLYSLYQQNKK